MTPRREIIVGAKAALPEGKKETDAARDLIFGFTGRERDEESDLQFNRARYYDVATGQWISEDPIGFSAGDMNVRRYVGNNATGDTDPSGLYGPMYLPNPHSPDFDQRYPGTMFMKEGPHKERVISHLKEMERKATT